EPGGARVVGGAAARAVTQAPAVISLRDQVEQPAALELRSVLVVVVGVEGLEVAGEGDVAERVAHAEGEGLDARAVEARAEHAAAAPDRGETPVRAARVGVAVAVRKI